MVEKDVNERRREKNLVSIVKEKVSDLRTGSITIIVLIALAVVGSLFAKYMITKLMSIDFVVVATSIALGIAGLIIVILLYVLIRWLGATVNRYFKGKGF